MAGTPAATRSRFLWPPRRSIRRRLGFLAFLLSTVAGLGACSTVPQPSTRAEPAPPQPAAAAAATPPLPPAEASPTTTTASAEAPSAEAAETKTPLPNSTVTYVESSAEPENKAPQTLAEAAKAEKERRSQAAPPKIVITNKTLPRYAKGQLTVADPHFQKPKAVVLPSPSNADSAHDEQYWRSHVLDTRLRWRHAVDEVKALEQDAADWRRRFYAQDDPYVRDGQIKPEWDHVLDRLRQSRAEVEKAKKDLADFLETGRREGAFPGWLREGIEQEPLEAKPVNPTDAIEPPVLQEPPGRNL